MNEKFEKIKKINFLSPYKRFKLILPFAEQQRLEELEKENQKRQSRVLCPENVPESVVPKEETLINEDVPLKNLKYKRKHDNDESESPSKKLKSTDNTENNETPNHVNEAPSTTTNTDATANTENKSDDSDADSVIVVDSLPPPIELTADSDNEESMNDSKSKPKSSKKEKKKNKFKNKQLSKNQTKQQSSQQVAFDYSKVDFKRFQGGSKKVLESSNPKILEIVCIIIVTHIFLHSN